MHGIQAESARIRSAWQGRVSGCLLGKPLEVLSFQEGREGVLAYLREAKALPLRDYVPLIEGTVVDKTARACCRGRIRHAGPDDDINYTVLALMMLEHKGTALTTEDVARSWLRRLPAGETWTAERSAYKTLLCNMADEFVNGDEPGFDVSLCSANVYNDWIGAQIRADLYGWVCPGLPGLAADLATRDASLSHRGEGVHAAAFIAALGAAIPATADLEEAIRVALRHIPAACAAADAVRLGLKLRYTDNAAERLHHEYPSLSPVHALNNLAVVVWALCSAEGDFTGAISNAVLAGWDTDCNGATVGALSGLSGARIPEHWTDPWRGRIRTSLAGIDTLELDDLVARTLAVAGNISGRAAA